MEMYATLNFTTVVAYAALVLTSLIWIVLIVDKLISKSELEKSLDKIEGRRSYQTDWHKVGVIFAIWFASGWYLFG